MMSLLWKQSKKKKLQTNQKRPSPTHIKSILSLAQGLFPIQLNNVSSIKGISLPTSWRSSWRASMTVEAAMVLPLFLFFFINLMSSIEMIRLHGNLQLAIWDVGNRMSVYGHVLWQEEAAELSAVEAEDSWWQETLGIVWSYTYVKSQIKDYLGEEYLESSPLINGVNGLQFWEGNVMEGEDCFEIVASYGVSPFSSIAGIRPFGMANRYYAHVWNGYDVTRAALEELVYVAENATVYHLDRSCTHLQLSIRQVTLHQAQNAENSQGATYRECEKCAGNRGEYVYITEEGDCFHWKRDCAGLKRSIACLPISEIPELRRCRRCAQAGEVLRE